MSYEYVRVMVTPAEMTQHSARGWEVVDVLPPVSLNPDDPIAVLMRKEKSEDTSVKRGPGRPRKTLATETR